MKNGAAPEIVDFGRRFFYFARVFFLFGRMLFALPPPSFLFFGF